MERLRSVRAWSPISLAPSSSAERSARPERNSLARWLFRIVEAFGPYLASSWLLSCQTVTSWMPCPRAVVASTSRSDRAAQFPASSRNSPSRGVQVDGVIAGQEVLQVQVMAVGGGAYPFVAVDGQDLLGRGVQRVDGPVGAVLAGLPGIRGRRHPRRFEDVLDLLVLTAVEPVQHLGHAEALGGGGEQHGGEELGPHGLPEPVLGPLFLGWGLLDRIRQHDGHLLSTGPGAAGGQGRPAGGRDAGGAQGVDDQDLADPGAVGQGGPQQVR